VTAPSDIQLGSAIVGLFQPHAGHERAFHRWYERDHLYTLGASAPGTLAASLWVAPKALRGLRLPRGDNPITGPSERGTHLSTFWIQRGMLDEQQAWVTSRMERQREAGTLFPHRDHLYTHRYEVRACVRRDPDGVPPELALHRGYPGVVACWIERRAGQALAELDTALCERALPRFIDDSPIELAIVLDLLPRPASWPADIPEPPGLGERLLALCFLAKPPSEVFGDVFADLADTLADASAGELLLAAPFDANVPGVDPTQVH
jgi:hypothetical protein